MASPAFMGDGSQLSRDSVFTESINQKMRVPERLRVGPRQQGGAEDSQRPVGPPPAYSMHIPDRLSYTDAPDMNPRPQFTPTKHSSSIPWDSQRGAWDRDTREPVQSPLRRSYSDTFGRSPPSTPGHARQPPYTPSSSRSAGHPPQYVAAADPQPVSMEPSAIPPSFLSPQTVLQAAKQLGQQASQRLLQAVTQKYRSRFSHPEHPPAAVAEPPAPMHAVAEPSRKSAMQDSWLNPEEDGGAAVEFIVLRRQVVKMSRRLAGLERQNAERRQTELVLFSLLLSACLLNGWLWIRR